MMRTRRIATLLLTAAAVLMLPQLVAADQRDPGPPGPPPFDRPAPPQFDRHMPGPDGPAAGPGPEGRFGPPPAGPWGKGPDLKELFRKFDKNKDGKLTLDEFTEGMKRLHEEMREHGRPGPDGPGPDGRRPPREGPGDRMGPPREGPGPRWDVGPRPGPEDGAACPPDGPCPDRKGPPQKPPAGAKKPGGDHNPGLEAKVRELEAKLRRLEARLDADK